MDGGSEDGKRLIQVETPSAMKWIRGEHGESTDIKMSSGIPTSNGSCSFTNQHLLCTEPRAGGWAGRGASYCRTLVYTSAWILTGLKRPPNRIWLEMLFH